MSVLVTKEVDIGFSALDVASAHVFISVGYDGGVYGLCPSSFVEVLGRALPVGNNDVGQCLALDNPEGGTEDLLFLWGGRCLSSVQIECDA